MVEIYQTDRDRYTYREYPIEPYRRKNIRQFALEGRRGQNPLVHCILKVLLYTTCLWIYLWNVIIKGVSVTLLAWCLYVTPHAMSNNYSKTCKSVQCISLLYMLTVILRGVIYLHLHTNIAEMGHMLTICISSRLTSDKNLSKITTVGQTCKTITSFVFQSKEYVYFTRYIANKFK